MGPAWLQEVPDAAGEVALEAADRLAGALAFAAASLDVVAGLRVAAGAGDDDAVQRRVDLAVAALVESVALRVARAGGDRRDAGGARELGGRGEALGAGDLADELGRRQRPEAGLVKQLRRDLLHERADLALEPVDRQRQLAQAAQLVARDLDAHRLLGAGEPPADAGRPLLREQGATRQPQLWPQIVQMPEQRAVELDAVTDEAFAMVDQQPQVELGPIQVRGPERLKTLLQRDAGHVERVDRIGLAPPTSALTRVGRQVRRDPQHPLTALDQEPLQRPRHVSAILKRPHALILEPARPPQQRAEPPLADRDGLLAEQLAGCRGDRRSRVRTLVSVRAEHDHCPRPPASTETDPGGHGLLEATPRIYQVTPEIPDRRRATKQKEVRP